MDPEEDYEDFEDYEDEVYPDDCDCGEDTCVCPPPTQLGAPVMAKDMKVPKTRMGRKPRRDWPEKVFSPPEDLADLVRDALVDFGPDGHSDGSDVIAALVYDWVLDNHP